VSSTLRNEKLFAELKHFEVCARVTIIPATNIEVIRSEVPELRQSGLRKRHTTETSFLTMMFLSPSNIEGTAARIEGQYHQELLQIQV
jgi:hypothetical protein